MMYVLAWALTGIGTGIAGYPLAVLMVGRRQEVSPFLAYPLGLVAISYLTWMPGMAGIARFTATTCWIALALITAVGWGLLYIRGSKSWSTANLRGIAASSLIYLAGLSVGLVVRGLDPSTASTEKPMDMAFLSSLIRSQELPPPDPWLAGYPINYYYMGYLAAAVQAKLAGVPSTIAFNLAVANYLALTVCGLFGTGLALSPFPQRRLWLTGLLSAGIVLVPGNLYAAVELLRRPLWVLSSDWWQGIGWNATRVIIDQLPGGPWPNITEFPSFSFLLGDMHPHVMALPLVATACALLVLLAHEDAASRCRWVAVAWLLGSLYPWNSWDLPTMLMAYSLTTSVLHRGRGRTWVETGLFRLGLLTVGAVLFYLPFWITFRPPVAGPGAPLPPEVAHLPLAATLSKYFGIVIHDHTGLDTFLIVNAVFLLPISVWLVGSYLRENASDLPKAMVQTGMGLLAIGAGPLVGVPIAGLLAVLGTLAARLLFDKHRPPSERAMASMVTISIMLFAICELVYIQDVFHNRMNTIFKFYYQAWLLLGVAAAGLIARWLFSFGPLNPKGSGESQHPATDSTPGMHGISAPWEAKVGLGVAVTALLMGLVYPSLAVPKKLMGQGWQGLDASSWVTTLAPDEWQAIQWLASNSEPDSIVLEGPGYAYSYGARISTYTGIPTVLGWANHERQWHAGDDRALAEIARRERDVRDFYRGLDFDVPRSYAVKYVVYGDFEQGKIDPRVAYPGLLQELKNHLAVAFRSNNTYIFRVGP
jgi:YYY domain-containing protein